MQGPIEWTVLKDIVGGSVDCNSRFCKQEIEISVYDNC